MLILSQALLRMLAPLQHETMSENREKTKTSELLRAKFAEAFPKGGRVKDKEIAERCHVTPQAVSNWRRTGRIDKQYLPILADLSGQPLYWWVGRKADQASEREVLLDVWSKLIPGQKREWMKRMKAQATANSAVRRHMREELRGTEDSKIEENFGSALRAAEPTPHHKPAKRPVIEKKKV